MIVTRGTAITGLSASCSVIFKGLALCTRGFLVRCIHVHEHVLDYLMENDLSPLAYPTFADLVKGDWQHRAIRAFPFVLKKMTDDYPKGDFTLN